MENTHACEIKYICENFLRRVEIPIQFVESDPIFYADCCREARSRGIDLDGATSILPYLDVGCDIAATAYAHLSYEVRVYIALYTAAAVGAEDACNNDVDLLKNFSLSLIKGKNHGNLILDTYDLLLRELAERFEPFAAEAMFQSALDFCVGLVLEYEVNKKPALARPAKEFPNFLRDLTGISRLYAIMIFIDGMPLRSWIEAVPALISYIQAINDIFSFYKEELANESNNFVSNKARSSGKPKIEALRSLTEHTVETYEEIVAVLSHNPAVLEAFKRFSNGYVDFHFGCKRYQLAKLWKCS